MTGWLVNDRLTGIEGTRTFWHDLLGSVDGLCDMTSNPYPTLAGFVESQGTAPDYIIRNAAYFRPMDVDAPTISFVQDILVGPWREVLVDVCQASQLVVFNSEYTKSQYPELGLCRSGVIPIGTDFDLFKPVDPLPGIDPRSALWIGAGTSVKGWGEIKSIAQDQPVVFILKDDAEAPGVTFRKITQDQIPPIAAACAYGICTSVQETQHLAGIEMGACGLPMVAPNVGIYYNRKPGAWSDLNASREDVRAYWLEQGLDKPTCMAAWREAIEEVCCVRG